ncbi:NUDIX hydrolase [Bacillus sp. FJAT-27445]|uniref:NUDIX hydrolase n=1 Tax=Bacillus sp. FJAT-27445 TaxID=1679166 RepID=UPI0007442728|nr:NUDIX hydrolase [Bacillus sp. FJAT-27445]
MKKWNTLASEYLYKTPFGNLRKDTCQLSNGIVIKDYYVNEYSDWVNAVVITEDSKIVLVKQYRHAGGDFFLEIPAGKIEENETHEEGILREVREETGFSSKAAPVKLGEFMVNPATQTNKVITYLIQDAFKETEQTLDYTEEIDVKLVDFNDFGGLIGAGEIKTQLFTASAYFMAKNHIEGQVPKDG